MKKFLFLSVIVIATMVSCNRGQIIDDSTNQAIENQEFVDFCLKIDSLNEVYIGMGDPTRSFLAGYLAESAADAVGSFVGGKIFSWAGATVGFAIANPVVAIGGYCAGRKFGSSAAAAAASFGASWIINHYGTRSANEPFPTLDENYEVPVNDPNNLSDGELHNLILSRLLMNTNKYVMPDGTLNYNLLLEDAYMYENIYSPFEDYSTCKLVCMSKTTEQVKRIVNSSILLKNEGTEVFLDDVYYNLIPEIQMSKEEFDNANVLNEKALSTYTMLDNDEALDFAESINEAIESSELDEPLKEDLKNSNSVLMNSTMMWKEVR